MRSGKFEQNSGNRRRIHIIPIVMVAAALALGCYFVSHFINRQALTQVSDIAAEQAPTVQTQVSQKNKETVEADPYEPYYKSYQSYIDWRLGFGVSPQNQYYSFYDLNGDGIRELITKDVYTLPPGAAEPIFELSIHTIVDGKIASVAMSGTSITNVCENGILMYSDPSGEFYEFYKLDGTSLRLVEKVSGDRAAETAKTYKTIKLDMKPFSEYPFS